MSGLDGQSDINAVVASKQPAQHQHGMKEKEVATHMLYYKITPAVARLEGDSKKGGHACGGDTENRRRVECRSVRSAATTWTV